MTDPITIELWQADSPWGPSTKLRHLLSEIFDVGPDDPTAQIDLVIHWDGGDTDRFAIPVFNAPAILTALRRAAFAIHADALQRQLITPREV